MDIAQNMALDDPQDDEYQIYLPAPLDGTGLISLNQDWVDQLDYNSIYEKGTLVIFHSWFFQISQLPKLEMKMSRSTLLQLARKFRLVGDEGNRVSVYMWRLWERLSDDLYCHSLLLRQMGQLGQVIALGIEPGHSFGGVPLVVHLQLKNEPTIILWIAVPALPDPDKPGYTRVETSAMTLAEANIASQRLQNVKNWPTNEAIDKRHLRELEITEAEYTNAIMAIVPDSGDFLRAVRKTIFRVPLSPSEVARNIAHGNPLSKHRKLWLAGAVFERVREVRVANDHNYKLHHWLENNNDARGRAEMGPTAAAKQAASDRWLVDFQKDLADFKNGKEFISSIGKRSEWVSEEELSQVWGGFTEGHLQPAEFELPLTADQLKVQHVKQLPHRRPIKLSIEDREAINDLRHREDDLEQQAKEDVEESRMGKRKGKARAGAAGTRPKKRARVKVEEEEEEESANVE